MTPNQKLDPELNAHFYIQGNFLMMRMETPTKYPYKIIRTVIRISNVEWWDLLK